MATQAQTPAVVEQTAPRRLLLEVLHDWVTTVDHKKIGLMYIGYAGHIQHYAVGMRGGDCQAVRLREVHERLIVIFGRPKARSELLGREIAVVIEAGRVVELLEQGVKFLLVAQGKTNG